ncbi:MAG: hypothetical protein WC815_13835 [Vicinamibacterales bacterium]|jgi:hypothetical protein
MAALPGSAFATWSQVDRQLEGRWPSLRSHMAAALRLRAWPIAWVLVCCVLSVGASYKRGWSQHPVWPAYEAKLAHPLSTPASPPEYAEHIGNMDLRLTVPAIGFALDLRRQGLSALYFVAGALVLLFAFRLIEQASADRVSASLATLGIAATSVGAQGFIGSPFYDPVATLLGVVCLQRFNRAALAAACLAALFVDERAIAMFPAILLSQWLHGQRSGSRARRDAATWLLLVAAVVAVWLGARWWLVASVGLRAPVAGDSVGLLALSHTFYAWPLLLASSLEAGWWVVALVAAGRPEPSRLVNAALVSAVALPMLLSMAAHDLSRSMSFALPAFVLCCAELARQRPRDDRRSIFLLVAIGNLACWDVLYYGRVMFAPAVPVAWLTR